VKGPGVVGLSWMFFEPLQVGPSALRRMLEEYFARAARELFPDENVGSCPEHHPAHRAVHAQAGFFRLSGPSRTGTVQATISLDGKKGRRSCRKKRFAVSFMSPTRIGRGSII